MQTRRNFIGNMATSLAGSFATGRVLGANERIRTAVIGVGDRGSQLAREAIASAGVEVVGFADVYRRRLEEAAAIASNAQMHADYRPLIEDPSIDAVII